MFTKDEQTPINTWKNVLKQKEMFKQGGSFLVPL